MPSLTSRDSHWLVAIDRNLLRCRLGSFINVTGIDPATAILGPSLSIFPFRQNDLLPFISLDAFLPNPIPIHFIKSACDSIIRSMLEIIIFHSIFHHYFDFFSMLFSFFFTIHAIIIFHSIFHHYFDLVQCYSHFIDQIGLLFYSSIHLLIKIMNFSWIVHYYVD